MSLLTQQHKSELNNIYFLLQRSEEYRVDNNIDKANQALTEHKKRLVMFTERDYKDSRIQSVYFSQLGIKSPQDIDWYPLYTGRA